MAEEDLLLSIRADLSNFISNFKTLQDIVGSSQAKVDALDASWKKLGFDLASGTIIGPLRNLQGQFTTLEKNQLQINAAMRDYASLMRTVNAEQSSYQALRNKQYDDFRRYIDASARQQSPVYEYDRATGRSGAALSKADDAYFNRFRTAFNQAKGDMAQTAQFLQISEDSARKLRESFLESGKSLKQFPTIWEEGKQALESWASHLVRIAGWIAIISAGIRAWQTAVKGVDQAAEFQTQTILAASYQRLRGNTGLSSIPQDNNELLREASVLAVKYGESLDVVVENLANWRKQIGDIQSAQYVEQEVLRYHAVTKVPTEELFRITLGLSKQAAGAGFGLENIDNTFKKVYAAAGFAGGGFRQLAENEKEVGQGADILLEALDKDAAALASFGLKQNQIIGLNQALIQAFGNTGTSANEAAEKVGRLLGSLAGMSNGAKFLQGIEAAGHNLNNTFNTSGQIINNIITLMKQLPVQQQLQLAHGLGGTRQYETAQTLEKVAKEAAELEKVISNQKNLNELFKVAGEIQDSYQQKLAKMHSEWEILTLTLGGSFLPILQRIVDFVAISVIPTMERLGITISSNFKFISDIFSHNWKAVGEDIMDFFSPSKQTQQQYKNIDDQIKAYKNNLAEIKKGASVDRFLRAASGPYENVPNSPFVGTSTTGVPKDYELFSTAVKDTADSFTDLIDARKSDAAIANGNIDTIQRQISAYGISEGLLKKLSAATQDYENKTLLAEDAQKKQLAVHQAAEKAAKDHADHAAKGSREQIGWTNARLREHTISNNLKTAIDAETTSIVTAKQALEQYAQTLRDKVLTSQERWLNLQQELDQRHLSNQRTYGGQLGLLGSMYAGISYTDAGIKISDSGTGYLYQQARSRYDQTIKDINIAYPSTRSREGGNYQREIDTATKRFVENITSLNQTLSSIRYSLKEIIESWQKKTIDAAYSGLESVISGRSLTATGAQRPGLQYQSEMVKLSKQWADILAEVTKEKERLAASGIDDAQLQKANAMVDAYQNQEAAVIQLNSAIAAYKRNIQEIENSAFYKGTEAGLGSLFGSAVTNLADQLSGANTINEQVGAYNAQIAALQQLINLENVYYDTTLYKTPMMTAQEKLQINLYEQEQQQLRLLAQSEKDRANNPFRLALQAFDKSFFDQIAKQFQDSIMTAMKNAILGGSNDPAQQISQAGSQYFIPASNNMMQAAQIFANSSNQIVTAFGGTPGSSIASSFNANMAIAGQSGGGGLLGMLLGGLGGGVGGGAMGLLGLGGLAAGGISQGGNKAIGTIAGLGAAGGLFAALGGSGSMGLLPFLAANPALMGIFAALIIGGGLLGGAIGPKLSPTTNPDIFGQQTNWAQLAANIGGFGAQYGTGSAYTSSQGMVYENPQLSAATGGLTELQYLGNFVNQYPGGQGLTGAELQLWQQANALTGGGKGVGLIGTGQGQYAVGNAAGQAVTGSMNWQDLSTQLDNATQNLLQFNSALQQGTTTALVGISTFGGVGLPFGYNVPGYNLPTGNYPYPGSVQQPGVSNPWINPLNPTGATTPSGNSVGGLPGISAGAGSAQAIIIQTPINLDGRTIARVVQSYQLRANAGGYQYVV